MRKTILTATAALLAGALTTSAAVTVQGWWHLDSTQPITDSSGNSRTFGSAYSTAPNSGGQVAALLINNGVGGPLGTSGYTSTTCIRLGVGIGGKRQSAMWGIGYNPPSTNYGIEIWAMPQNEGYVNNTTWYFSSGQSGGVVLRCVNNGDGTASMVATILGANVDVGAPALIDTTRWTHYAIVNDNGTTTFYTNGVQCGDSDIGNATASAGDAYVGTPSDNQAPDAYLDEARMFTFASGAFSTNDLLLRPAGPIFISQPQSIAVWNGGAATLNVNPSFNTSLLYQWRSGGSPIANKTDQNLYFNTLTLTDSGSNYDCIVTADGLAKTTAPPAVVTVVPVNPANVAAYRDAVNAEASLIAYFPVDGDTGTTLSNTKDAGHNGAFETASYDGRTNTTFGQRSIAFQGDGDIQIPNNAAFEFPSGNGTIEALVYLSGAQGTEPTIFAKANDGGDTYYVIGASKDGGNLICYSATTNQVSWPVPGGLIGAMTHIAVVFDSGGNVTAYANGQNLGTKAQAGYGAGTGSPAWIGAVGSTVTDYRWVGTIDELAVYSSALPQNTVQRHFSNFYYGTNTAKPSIASQPASKSLYAGGSPTLVVKAGGTLPLTYQWSTNGVAVADGTTASLTLPAAPAGSSITCSLKIDNAYGTTNIQPIVLSFVAPPAGYPTAIMNDNPAGFWRLAESAGPTATDSAGVNNGTYAGSGVTYAVAGTPGGGTTAVLLDGAAGCAVVPYAAALNPGGPFTIEFWAKLSAATGSSPFSSMNRPSRSGGYEFYNELNYAGWEFHTAAVNNYNALTGDGTAPAIGEWYHVAGVFDGFAIYLYVNGEPASTFFTDSPALEEGTPVFAPNAAVDFYIGCRSDLARFFSGSMCDVAFYSHALTQDQLRRHVFAGLGSSINVSLTRVAGIVADSKPVGTLHAGVNNGATWLAANSDGATTRNGVLSFDGNVTNQVTVAANPDLNSTQGTIMFWMRSSGTVGSATGGAMLFDHRTSDPGGDIIVQNDDGSIAVQAQNGSSRNGSGNTVNAFSAGSVSDNNWHHIAYVYDQSATGSTILYIDGAESMNQANSYAWNWPVVQEIELGASHDTYWKAFNGQMDDFRVYNRVLTAGEIASVHTSDTLVDTAALKVRLNFDTAPADGLGVNWTPSVALPQVGTAASGTFVDQANGRTPYLVVPTAAKAFFRAKSP